MNKLASLIEKSSVEPSGPNPCFWQWVKCEQGSVSHLSLSRLDLSDLAVLSLVCDLDSLQSLDLSLNKFTSLSSDFLSNCGRLDGLKLINFTMNQLSGPLPDFVGFSSLESLDLSGNSLNGGIGSQLDGLSQIRSLNLSNNQIGGSLPTKLGNGTTLQELQLSKNLFFGVIPDELLDYRNLTFLDLSWNRLTGSVPDKIGELFRLDTLILSSNDFSGELPLSLSNIMSLSRFSANQNRFSGSIPWGLTRYLKVLDLSTNKFNGSIPENLLSPPNLKSVDLTYNSLRGPIPGNISTDLFRLRLSHNSLNGSIPQAIGDLSKLMYLELNDNGLTGVIPANLGNCKNLQLLDLGQNGFEGSVPKEIGSLRDLVSLKLEMNHLSGQIPMEFSQLKNLTTLNCSGNSLSGEIPSVIFNSEKLSNLILSDNELDGSIPDAVSDSNNLLELQLGKNKLSGKIPRMPPSLQIALNLSGNLFNGSIPPTLDSLMNLEVLDLSNNEFTGEIPTFLTHLSSLTHLVLLNNQLSGILPNFNPKINVSISGNKVFFPPPLISGSHPTPSSKKNIPAVLVILVAVGSAALALGLVAVGYIFISRRLSRVEDIHPQSEEEHPQVIVSHLLTIDGIHQSSLNFSKALEAVNSPANLMLQSRFATFYKATMPSGMNYCVKKINWGEKILQLGNNERFGQVMEALARLSNSRIMIPLAYALTKDDAFLLYEYNHKGTLFDFLHKSLGSSMDWPSRYSIALGVAQGLAYLHGCSDPVLLLDLSSKSILLKSLTLPQIADIELSNVIDPSKINGSFSKIAGSVGYVPPEYAYTMRVTMAGNVYSFGVVLLELLTGKQPVTEGTELAKWVLSASAQSDVRDQILDSRISKTTVADRNQMLSVLNVAQACVSVSPDARPKIKNVVRMLLNAR
ncbi:leucine-rich repeat receptor-like tyrosine-protein kinase PXC3 [Aristolochia californica]|uniref:leucine-rich repeat receptor-like tyrosine-protein kinase PXC3 n=1 Tax=Aristolochia californica TaxID=171875 RepID=UPI0035E29F33